VGADGACSEWIAGVYLLDSLSGFELKRNVERFKMASMLYTVVRALVLAI